MLTGYIAVRFESKEWHACEPRINVSEDDLTLQWHGMLIIQKEQPGSSLYDALHCKDNWKRCIIKYVNHWVGEC